MSTRVPTDAKTRKGIPLCTGVLDYFPDALLAVAELSRIGNEQHSPGQPLHWAKEKSTDEPDALLRHLIDRGKLDTDGVRHSAKVAWRALALLQREIEAECATPPGTITVTSRDTCVRVDCDNFGGPLERRIVTVTDASGAQTTIAAPPPVRERYPGQLASHLPHEPGPECVLGCIICEQREREEVQDALRECPVCRRPDCESLHIAMG
jgi:hypothetical protein